MKLLTLMLLGFTRSMLEVGNLANSTEDRSHFGAWCIISSPLILSFNLSDPNRMERAWPIITNQRLLAVNQMWAGEGKQPSLTLKAIINPPTYVDSYSSCALTQVHRAVQRVDAWPGLRTHRGRRGRKQWTRIVIKMLSSSSTRRSSQ